MMNDEHCCPSDLEDPAHDLRQTFAKIESERTGKPTFADVMRQTLHGPPILDGPRAAALSSFLQSVVGTPFERPIWEEYHRRKWLDDATLTAAVGIANAEGLRDPDCGGMYEVWAGFLLAKLKSYASTVPGWPDWQNRGAPQFKKNPPFGKKATIDVKSAVSTLMAEWQPGLNVDKWCDEYRKKVKRPDWNLRKIVYDYLRFPGT